MLRMCEEHVPPELNKVSFITCDIKSFAKVQIKQFFFIQMTQKDIAFVADFLSEHFSEVSPSK